MEQSKERIQSLGYFDQREGVNWKIIRTGENAADLDLMLKEAKTGHADSNLALRVIQIVLEILSRALHYNLMLAIPIYLAPVCGLI